MFEDRDLLGVYYAERLWRLLPEVYRAKDSEEFGEKGPLRELIERLAIQVAWVRRSIERSWEDQSIETCDDWLIPYLGDLLACNLVEGLDARAQRIDVAKTIYYRRRKGTLAVLEELAVDVTGWSARAVEFFRGLSRTRHNFDPPIGQDHERALIQGLTGARSSTAAGGFADLRHCPAAQSTHSAFNEFFHTADFRRGRDKLGWHNIPKLGFFLWRLHSLECVLTTPVEDAQCPGQYTFDPSGREAPLFAKNRRDQSQYGDAWVTPDQWMLPTPISNALWEEEQEKLYPESLSINRVSGALAETLPLAENPVYPEKGRFKLKSTLPAGAVVRTNFHYGFPSWIGAGPFDRSALNLVLPLTPEPVAPLVLGGADHLQSALAALGASGTVEIGDSLTYTNPGDITGATDIIVRSGANQRTVVRADGTPWVISGADTESRFVLEGIWWFGADLILRGDFEEVVLLCSTLDPGQDLDLDGQRPKAVDGRLLDPVTLWIEGRVGNLVLQRSICGPIRTRLGGVVEKLQIEDSIVQGVLSGGEDLISPAEIADAMWLARRLKLGSGNLVNYLRDQFSPDLLAALDSHDVETEPEDALLESMVEGLNAALPGEGLPQAFILDHVSAPIDLEHALAEAPGGDDLIRLNRMLVEISFPLELGQAAVAVACDEINMVRSTVLGRAYGRRISASETILAGYARADDIQNGCVRFSSYVLGSMLHQPYESVTTRESSALFVCRRFGDPAYAQLARFADSEILSPEPGDTIKAGAQNGSEMGAYALEKYPIKERGLLIKLREYMPVGLTPVLIYQT